LTPEEFSKKYEVLKQDGLVDLYDWLRKKFDMTIRFTATDTCPICYLIAHPTAAYGKFEHPTPIQSELTSHTYGISHWAYNKCYDPTRVMLQFYDAWFNLNSPEVFVTVAHEALHGYLCKSGDHGYCGDIPTAKDAEVEERAKLLVEEFRSQRIQTPV